MYVGVSLCLGAFSECDLKRLWHLLKPATTRVSQEVSSSRARTAAPERPCWLDPDLLASLAFKTFVRHKQAKWQPRIQDWPATKDRFLCSIETDLLEMMIKKKLIWKKYTEGHTYSSCSPWDSMREEIIEQASQRNPSMTLRWSHLIERHRVEEFWRHWRVWSGCCSSGL